MSLTKQYSWVNLLLSVYIMVFIMTKRMKYTAGKNKVSADLGISGFEILNNLAWLMALATFAGLVLSLTNVATNNMKFDPKNPHFIAAVCSAAAFVASLLLILASTCFNERKESDKRCVKFNYGVRRSNVSLILIGLSAVSFVASAAFLGSLHHTGVSALLDFRNPLCIGLYASLAVLALSLLTYTVKNLLAPDNQCHVIVMGDTHLVNNAREHEHVPGPILRGLNIDLNALSSLRIIDCMSELQ